MFFIVDAVSLACLRGIRRAVWNVMYVHNTPRRGEAYELLTLQPLVNACHSLTVYYPIPSKPARTELTVPHPAISPCRPLAMPHGQPRRAQQPVPVPTNNTQVPLRCTPSSQSPSRPKSHIPSHNNPAPPRSAPDPQIAAKTLQRPHCMPSIAVSLSPYQVQ